MKRILLLLGCVVFVGLAGCQSEKVEQAPPVASPVTPAAAGAPAAPAGNGGQPNPLQLDPNMAGKTEADK